MDFLDNILNGMEKPPTIKKPEIKDKEKREKLEKLQRERQEAARKQKEMVDKFRRDITTRIRDFVHTPTTSDEKSIKLKFKPMSKLYRTIVREVCDDYVDELIVHSFGEDEVDRHCIIWRKGYEPCEEEIHCMKVGVEYKPPGADKDVQDNQEEDVPAESKNEDGKDKFWSKYERIIGENSYGIEASRVAEPAKQYGCVPVANKKDQRSIEETMDDIRRKKQKTEPSQETEESTSASKEESTESTSASGETSKT